MEFVTVCVILLSSAVVFLCFHGFKRSSSSKLPPGPTPLPIIGNLLHFGQDPHRSLAKLSKIYGPLMYLKLGSIKSVVVSSPETAKEVLQKNDQICSSRAVPYALQAVDHDKVSVAFMPAGTEWRKLRKICKEQMFTMSKLQASEPLRQDKLRQLRDYVAQCSAEGRDVNIGEIAFITSLNLISATLFAIDFAHFDSNSAQEMKQTVVGLMKVVGAPNLADYFPILKFFDPQGIVRETGVYFSKLMTIFDEIINQRLLLLQQSSDHSPAEKDLLQVLLHLNQQSDSTLTIKEIKHLLLVSITIFVFIALMAIGQFGGLCYIFNNSKQFGGSFCNPLLV